MSRLLSVDEVDAMLEKVKKAEREVLAILTQDSQLKQLISEKNQEAKEATEERKALASASTLLKMAMTAKVNVKRHIEGINTGIFKAVFGNAYDYVFEPRTDSDGMVTGLIPQIRYMGVPMKSGGGATNIAGIGNRFGLVFADPTAPPIMILDEPSSNLDSAKWERFIETLVELSGRTGTQIFMVSHSGYRFDQVFSVAKVGVSSKIHEKNAA